MVLITSRNTWWGRGKTVLLGKLVLAAHLAALAGCDGLGFGFLQSSSKTAPPPDAAESLILRPDGLAADKPPPVQMPEDDANKLAKAREYFRAEEYAKAESFYTSVADREKNPPAIVQEAMYYQAESLRLQGHLPKAADTYAGLLGKFPNTPYREQCVQHMFDIANRWLDDTREQMREEKERQAGKRWFVWPRFVSFETSKPLLDREGRAINTLEQVRLYDINGPLADQALFLCGVVKMYNENYRDADMYFTQIYARHPESSLAPKAIELGIQCKHLSTGGSDYDGRKTAEARNMVTTALGSYPQLAHDKEMRRFLEDQRASIDLQQAKKEFDMAEFWRRTGHPGSAYFYYKLVERRYPNTKYARMAMERWNSLREELEKEQNNPSWWNWAASPLGAVAPTPMSAGPR
jgi:outer membrane protein assembly factor BamD (BamD/ComL family)